MAAAGPASCDLVMRIRVKKWQVKERAGAWHGLRLELPHGLRLELPHGLRLELPHGLRLALIQSLSSVLVVGAASHE